MSEQLLSDSQINVKAAHMASRITYQRLQHPVLESVELNALSGSDVHVQTLYSGISKGTERLVFSGKVPTSEHKRMRCPHQVGEFTFPVTYGYACVGKVIATGTDVRSTNVGDHVFVLHPHQDWFVVDEQWINVIPNSVTNLKSAVLSANLETALNANWDAEIETANSIAVVGAGVVGLLTAFIAKHISGSIPEIIDIDPQKQSIAEKLGLKFVHADDAGTGASSRFDCVFHTSASQTGLQLSLNIAEFEGRVIEMSWYGDKEVSLVLGGAFHSQRLEIRSSQVGTIAKQKRHSISHSERMAMAMEYLKYPALENLLFPVVQFTQLPDIIDELLISDTSLCPLVTY